MSANNVRIQVQIAHTPPRLPGVLGKAYAAGMMDGDGCIHICRQKKSSARRGHIFRLEVNVSQNHLATLLDFQSLVGVEGRIYQKPRVGCQNKDTYSLGYSGAAATEVIRTLLPFLHRKLDEAELAIRFDEEGQIRKHFGPQGCPEDVWNLREKLYRKMRDLK